VDVRNLTLAQAEEGTEGVAPGADEGEDVRLRIGFGKPPRRTPHVTAQPVDTIAPDRAYTARHLSVLEGLEAVRKRPGMYIGSTDARGLMHCLW
jgi:hypothetical protein